MKLINQMQGLGMYVHSKMTIELTLELPPIASESPIKEGFHLFFSKLALIIKFYSRITSLVGPSFANNQFRHHFKSSSKYFALPCYL